MTTMEVEARKTGFIRQVLKVDNEETMGSWSNSSIRYIYYIGTMKPKSLLWLSGI